MASLAERYVEFLNETLKKIYPGEMENVRRAAELVAKKISEGGVVHVFGTGAHSILMVEDIFFRAGGLAPLNAIFDFGLFFGSGARRALRFEHLSGYAGVLLDYHGVGEGDLVVIFNDYGINHLSIEAAMECRSRGATVIAFTCPQLSDSAAPDNPARHPSGKNLYEIADVVIDTHVPVGLCVLEAEDLPAKICHIQTVTNSLLINLLVATVVEILLERGEVPPIWTSVKAPGAAEFNKRWFEEYGDKIKHL
ncbi:MAG: sugar isomerase domain-containing protein [Candidatus Geothermarchaeales archaeon]